MHSFTSNGSGSPGLPWFICRPFLGTMMTGAAHMLIVHWIIPASSSLLSVLSTQGLNFNGIVYGADIHGGPLVPLVEIFLLQKKVTKEAKKQHLKR